jgi:hypothetical protein
MISLLFAFLRQYLSANEHYEIVLDPSEEDAKLMSD